MNAKMRKAYESYRMSDKYSLYDAYGSFSPAKRRAWGHCEKLRDEKNGRWLKVIGANSNFFSAGFEYEEDGKKKFMYITHGGDYSVDLEEDK